MEENEITNKEKLGVDSFGERINFPVADEVADLMIEGDIVEICV